MKNIENEIERLAYVLSKQKGTAGSDLDHWLQAERIVAEWLKKRQKAEDATDEEKQDPAV